MIQNNGPAPSLLVNLVGRAPQWLRRGHEFKYSAGLIFFQAYFSLYCLSSVNYSENRFHIHLTLINATGAKKNSGLFNFCVRNGNIPGNLMTGVEGLNIITVVYVRKS